MLKWLVVLARTRVLVKISGKLFILMIDHLPLNRIYDSPTLAVFYHPQPVFAVHLLVVPKQSLPGIHSLEAKHAELLYEITEAARQVAHQLGLDNVGYRLILNCGNYQEFPQFHLHLVSDTRLDTELHPIED